MIETATSRIRVSAAPHIRSVGTGFGARRLLEIWSYIMPGSEPMNPLNRLKLIDCA